MSLFLHLLWRRFVDRFDDILRAGSSLPDSKRWAKIHFVVTRPYSIQQLF